MSRRSVGLVSMLIWLFHAAPAVLAETPPPLPADEQLEAPEPAPLVVWGRTVAVFRAAFEGASPADRAQRAAARITALPPRGDWEIRSTKATVGKASGFVVGTKSTLFFGLLPEDLDPASGKTLEETARLAAQELQAVLDDRAEQLRWPVFLRGLGFTAGATLVYAAVLWLVFFVRRLGMRRLDRVIAQSRKSLSVAGIDLVPILHWFQRAVGKVTSLAAALVATYLWLTFCFAQFFYTQPWANQLGAFLLGVLKG
ncbi:MAG: hypothetical protein IH608_12245, partial [Proteobacteria bacterium]|nr:hypothetical protein [Pseudomonadota bacterium]